MTSKQLIHNAGFPIGRMQCHQKIWPSLPVQSVANGLSSDFQIGQVYDYDAIVQDIVNNGGNLPHVGWKAGDANVPSHWNKAVNSSTIFSSNGSPYECNSPFDDIVGECHDGTSWRKTATVMDPVAGDDIVVHCLIRFPNVIPVGLAGHLLTNWNGADAGWAITLDRTYGSFGFVTYDGGSLVYRVTTNVLLSEYVFATLIAEYGGNTRLHLNGSSTGLQATAMPAGQVGAGNGFAIGQRLNGFGIIAEYTEVLWATVYYGVGIADIYTADSYSYLNDIFHKSVGIYPKLGSKLIFTRATSGSTAVCSCENLAVDGDMEDPGVSDWTAVSATLTKNTTDPKEGARCLKIEPDGATNARATQAVLTVGKQYTIHGHARGTNNFAVSADGATDYVWTGSPAPANKWVDFSVTFVASGTSFGLHSTGSLSGNVEFDDVILNENSNFMFSSGMPRISRYEMSIAGQRVNKCYNNINPTVTTGLAVTGGSLSVVDESTDLELSGERDWGPNAFKFVSTGANHVIYCGASTGNTNKHALSVIVKGDVGGETVELGFRDVSSGVFTQAGSFTVRHGYTRILVNDVTPGDTDEQFAIRCQNGETIYFIAQQCEEGIHATSEIPNRATAATATRNQDVFEIPIDPLDSKGGLICTPRPVNWNGVEAGDVQLVSRKDTPGDLLYADGGTAGWATYDGTNELINDDQSPQSGIEHTVEVHWSDSVQKVSVDRVTESGAYDGALDGDGNLIIASDGPEIKISRFGVFKE